jgi:hypothetical protein
MYKFLPLIVASLLLSSCTSKNSAFKYFDKDDIETKSIQYTKKADILKGDEIETIMWATYLNKIDKNIYNYKQEVFLVSLYFANAESQSIKENGYKFLLNGKESTLIEKIEKDNENFKSLMSKNSWGNYYLVKFDMQNNDVTNLKLELTEIKPADQKSSKKAILDFEK